MKIFILMLFGIMPFGTFGDFQIWAETPRKLGNALWCLDYQNRPLKTQIRRSPDETMTHGGGDCMDLGILVYEVLKYHDYAPKMYKVMNDATGHIIVSYDQNNERGYFSNLRWYEGPFNIDDYIKHSQYTYYREILDWENE